MKKSLQRPLSNQIIVWYCLINRLLIFRSRILSNRLVGCSILYFERFNPTEFLLDPIWGYKKNHFFNFFIKILWPLQRGCTLYIPVRCKHWRGLQAYRINLNLLELFDHFTGLWDYNLIYGIWKMDLCL